MEVRDIDLPWISLTTVGMFDIVLFCGVLYHLENMMAGLALSLQWPSAC